MNSECALTSQHPYTERIGKPRVHNVDLDDVNQVLESVKEALKFIDEQTKQMGGGVDPFIPDDFQFVNFVKRLDTSLRANYCKNS